MTMREYVWRGASVTRIMINCPQTGQAVSTGMAADKAC